MQAQNSSAPPKPKSKVSSRELRDTWRPSSAPPRGTPSGGPRHEQRASPRTRLRHAIQFLDADGQQYDGVCRNLSLGGAAIQTAEPAAFGARVTVIIELDGIEGETRLGGTVRWSKPGVMGVQWDSFGVRVTHALLRTAAQRD
jgi:PilZ domain